MKRAFKILAVAFVAFEVWRLALVGALVLPFWHERLLPALIGFSIYPPLELVVAVSISIVAFVVPMAGVVLVIRFVHRRLSRFRTVR